MSSAKVRKLKNCLQQHPMLKLYLPGTNKNVGYLDDSTMHIYKRCIKYLPFNNLETRSILIVSMSQHLIFELREKKTVKNIQLASISSYAYLVNSKEWTFYDCQFKTPDNLDLIEMAYLYKHWKKK
jgi:hypothetical protein